MWADQRVQQFNNPILCQEGTYVVVIVLWLSRLLEHRVISDSISTFYQRSQFIYYSIANSVKLV